MGTHLWGRRISKEYIVEYARVGVSRKLENDLEIEYGICKRDPNFICTKNAHKEEFRHPFIPFSGSLTCYVPLAIIKCFDPRAFRVRAKKVVIIHLANSIRLVKAVFFKSVMYSSYYCRLRRANKNISAIFGVFSCCWLATLSPLQHLASRLWFPTIAVWRTRHRHTSH